MKTQITAVLVAATFAIAQAQELRPAYDPTGENGGPSATRLVRHNALTGLSAPVLPSGKARYGRNVASTALGVFSWITGGEESGVERLESSPQAMGQAGRAYSQGTGVFSPDDRERVSDTSKYPWSHQCQLIAYWKDGTSSLRSGAMVANQWVITAGHCVYDQSKGWAKSVWVRPGVNGSTKPFLEVWSTDLYAFDDWVSKGDYDDDMGLIKLPSDPGATGWMSLMSASNIVGDTCYLSGYPTDLSVSYQYYDYDPIDDQTTNRYYHCIDADTGQRGAAVYRVIDGVRYVVGVQSGYTTWSSGKVRNRATRLTNSKHEAVYDLIN